MATLAADEFRSVESVLRARSLALVGASERGRWPGLIVGALRERGYAGKVFLVNPRQSEVFGERAFPTLRDLPEPVDHAMVIVPAAAVTGVVEDAHAAGLKSLTIYAGGVGDGADEASQARGRFVRELLSRSTLRVAGPNCMGAFSYREKIFAYPNADLAKLEAGPVGCVFQSGGTLQFFMKTAASRGLRFSYGVSSGNEIDLDLADYVNFLVDDEHTRQIVLFVEGIRRPRAFMRAAARALEAGKPVLTIKTGATARSREAAQSHTGAIAGDYAAYLAMCERYGIVNCANLDDLVETTLAFQSTRRPKGPRIGFVTTSGGTVDLLYDYVELEGATLATFSPQTDLKLKPYMQDEIEPRNPLDVGIPSTMQSAADLCAIVAADDGVDMLAWAGQLPPRRSKLWEDTTPLRDMLAATEKPVIGFARMTYQVTQEAQALQSEVGFPFLQGLQPSLRAMNALWFHAQRQGSAPETPVSAPASDLTPDNLHDALARYGIRLPRTERVDSAEAAAQAAARIGFPVVLKIRSPDILHKTEALGVALDLRSESGVLEAAERMKARALDVSPGARIEGFDVQEMVAGGVEAIVGARDDALYGPMLLVGSGGVLVEWLADVSLAMLPLERPQLAGMIDKLKVATLLAGYRGRPAADRAALEEVALALGRFFLDHRERIADIEINPVAVKQAGDGAIALDVRVLWR
ncbi:MAG: acetyl-CoA synthetase [Hyphomicrobiales bacterium]|nr:acetyl-CoA synthetase [Hyphomicrobiales bacterium]